MSFLKPQRNINIVLAGVGGQGSITAGQIAARAGALSGSGVVLSEVHGMSQRGGSVMSTVRFGDTLCPTIPLGQADFLMGFEKLEALRYAHYLKPGGRAIVNDQSIMPAIESLKKVAYPADIFEQLKTITHSVLMVPALEYARKIGNPKLVSTVILGAFSACIDIPGANWAQAIEETVPFKTIFQNLAAFEAGREFVIHTSLQREIVAFDAISTNGGVTEKTLTVLA